MHVPVSAHAMSSPTIGLYNIPPAKKQHAKIRMLWLEQQRMDSPRLRANLVSSGPHRMLWLTYTLVKAHMHLHLAGPRLHRCFASCELPERVGKLIPLSRLQWTRISGTAELHHGPLWHSFSHTTNVPASDQNLVTLPKVCSVSACAK